MAESWYVDKITSTPSETLVAFALAELLDRVIPPDLQPEIQVLDQGDHYQITSVVSIEIAWLAEIKPLPLIQPLDTAKKKSGLPGAIDYVEQQQRNNNYFAARKKGQSDAVLAEQGLTPPHPDWPGWAIINQMAATNAYNKLIETWYAHHACFANLLQLIFELYSQRPNDLDAAEEKWKQLAKRANISFGSQAPQLQAINPGMGKGGNKSKASGLSIGGLSGFWLVEYLKFTGLFYAALPRTISNSKDRKTYVLRPKALHWTTHRKIFPNFQRAVYAQSSIKMDILATLRYCEVFLDQWKAGQAAGALRFALRPPGDHVAALEVVHYKHLGSAHATLNLSALVLPAWLPMVETVTDANLFLALLGEHATIIRNLEEKHSDEYELLRHYRNFLSARDLREFYAFCASYADHVMRKLIAAGFPPRRFHVTNLEILIMNHNPKLKPIVENAGFRRIAEAIRSSTVTPQFFKAKKNPGPYEIRYGLGADLLRNASYPEKFAQALSKFIFEYNQENQRINERYKGEPPVRRITVRTGDLEQLLALIDEYDDSETVANLLVAFGYATDPRQSNSTDGQTQQIEENDGAGEDSPDEAANDESDE